MLPQRRRYARRQLVYRPCLEPLEDRLAPAASITIINAPSGTGSQDANLLADGQVRFVDPDVGANTLSSGALAAIAATTPIVVEATDFITFNDLGGTLTLLTGPGTSATFSTATLGGHAVSFVNLLNTLATSGGSLFFKAGTTLTPAKLATAGGDVSLTADRIDLQQAVNAGMGAVTLQPLTAATRIELGGMDGAGVLGISDTELSQVTAVVVRVGDTANSGGISVSSAITRHDGCDALTLITLGAVTQSAPLSVAKLVTYTLDAVTLGDPANDVDALAGAVFGFAADFTFTDADGFAVSTLDTVAGIGTDFGRITLTAGAAVTQGPGTSIVGEELLLLGAGPFTLAGSFTNDVEYIAADLTGIGAALDYIDANALEVSTVNGIGGVHTTNGDVTLQTFNGTLTVDLTTNPNSDIGAGSGKVRLFAFSFPGSDQDNAIVLRSDCIVLGHGGVTIEADHIRIAGSASVDAGSAIATLAPDALGTNIDLGGADAPSILGLTQTELNTVTAGILRIGNLFRTRHITVTSPITARTTGWDTLSLLTDLNGTISQAGGASLTVTNLLAAAGEGVALNDPGNTVSVLAGAAFGHFVAQFFQGAPFSFVNSTSLVVGTVDEGVGGYNEIEPEGVGKGINTVGNVRLTIHAAEGSLTVNQPVDTIHFVPFGSTSALRIGDHTIKFTADHMTLGAHVFAGGLAYFAPRTAGATIAVGGADAPGTLGLDDSELKNVAAVSLVIGNPTQTGPITIAGTVDADRGVGLLVLDATGPGGAITHTGGSLVGGNLVLRADSGIGSGDALSLGGPCVVEFNNATAGNVQIDCTGAMTVKLLTDRDVRQDVANHAMGGTTTLTATGPLTFAVPVTSSGDLTAIATDGAGRGNNLTVEGFVHGVIPITIRSLTGNVTLKAGDDLRVQAGAVVQADAGTVLLEGDSGSVDIGAGAVIDVRGTVVSGDGPPVVRGGPDADTIIVSVGASNTAFDVEGQDPTTFAGDSLRLLLTGVTGTMLAPNGVGSGTFTFGNRPRLTFRSIEQLSPGLTIRGRVFHDLNLNGVADAGEPGLAGWVVHLDRGADGSSDAAAVTDATGSYAFADLGPASYRVRAAGQVGWVATSAGFGDVVPITGMNDITLDFGNYAVPFRLQRAWSGRGLLVRVFNADGSLRFVIHPYGPTLRCRMTSVLGDVTGDRVPDIQIELDGGLARLVIVFDGRTGRPLRGVRGDFHHFLRSGLGSALVAALDGIGTPLSGESIVLSILLPFRSRLVRLRDFFGIRLLLP